MWKIGLWHRLLQRANSSWYFSETGRSLLLEDIAPASPCSLVWMIVLPKLGHWRYQTSLSSIGQALYEDGVETVLLLLLRVKLPLTGFPECCGPLPPPSGSFTVGIVSSVGKSIINSDISPLIPVTISQIRIDPARTYQSCLLLYRSAFTFATRN